MTPATAIVDANRLVLCTRDQDYSRVGGADFHQPRDGDAQPVRPISEAGQPLLPIVRLLEHEVATLRQLDLLCWKVASGELPTNAGVWQTWKRPITDIATALPGSAAAESGEELMMWEDERGAVGAFAAARNIFSYPDMEPTVRIKIGSIQSVKGETHLATLVVDTPTTGPTSLGSGNGLRARNR